MVTTRRTPRPPSSIRVWLAPPRNGSWIAARIGLG